MKKVLLSTAVILTMSAFANAAGSKSSAEAEAEIEALKAQMSQMADRLAQLEKSSSSNSSGTLIQSSVPKLKIGGLAYLGFTSSKEDGEDRTNKFEIRRNYIDVSAYFADNPKDYFRTTLDIYQDSTSGAWDTKLKHAYLYLDEILPSTGVELGMAHRPWVDYEQNNAWFYRAVSKVLVEDKNHGADFVGSADLGVNFQTKTPYFSSELGVYNGEGYDKKTDGLGLSEEWRLTGHLLGTGKEKAGPNLQYANVSFFGQRAQDDSTRGLNNKDFNWMGVHAVYNQPEFLIAAQYVNSQRANAGHDGKAYGVNGEFRFLDKWALLGMYTKVKLDSGDDKKGVLGGIAYDLNKNIKLIGNYLVESNNDIDTKSLMATAQVKW